MVNKGREKIGIRCSSHWQKGQENILIKNKNEI
jgi:hypothetical protein